MMGLYTFPKFIPGWTITTILGPVVPLQPFMRVSVSVPPTVLIAHPPTVSTMNKMNNSPLTHKLLPQTLLDLSERLYHSFRRQLRLFVHGVAASALHPLFAPPRERPRRRLHPPFLRVRISCSRTSRRRATFPDLNRGDRSQVRCRR